MWKMSHAVLTLSMKHQELWSEFLLFVFLTSSKYFLRRNIWEQWNNSRNKSWSWAFWRNKRRDDVSESIPDRTDVLLEREKERERCMMGLRRVSTFSWKSRTAARNRKCCDKHKTQKSHHQTSEKRYRTHSPALSYLSLWLILIRYWYFFGLDAIEPKYQPTHIHSLWKINMFYYEPNNVMRDSSEELLTISHVCTIFASWGSIKPNTSLFHHCCPWSRWRCFEEVINQEKRSQLSLFPSSALILFVWKVMSWHSLKNRRGADGPLYSNPPHVTLHYTHTHENANIMNDTYDINHFS